MKFMRFFWIIAILFFCVKTSYAQVSIKTTLDADGVTYKVYMVSTKTFTGSNSLISSSQITVVVPHGLGSDYFQFSNPVSPIANMKWLFSGRADAPIENPDKDYLFFNFINNNSPIVKFDMIANQEILLFSFKRISRCIGKTYTFDSKTDPFVSPNSLGANTGNNFTVFGAGGDAYIGNTDVPISVNIVADKVNSCAGSEVVYTATPSVSGNYTYQWYIDDKPQGTASSNRIFRYTSSKNEADFVSKISVKLIESTTNPCDAYSTRKNLNANIKGVFNAKIDFGGYNCMVLPTSISVKLEPSAQYQWQESSQDIVGAKTNTLQVKKSGTYVVKVSKNGCLSTSDPLKIVGISGEDKLTVDAGKDTTILEGESFQLKGSSDKAATYNWSPAQSLSNPNIAQPIARPRETTKYTLTASNESGCPTTASVTITVMPQLYIPTAFSPNNDGLNDDFKIENVGFYPESTVEIYNRWGNIIFFSEGYNEAWNGKNVEATTYSYVVRTKYKIYKGTVEVLR
jgi:gliding motility-associated-like protein